MNKPSFENWFYEHKPDIVHLYYLVENSLERGRKLHSLQDFALFVYNHSSGIRSKYRDTEFNEEEQLWAENRERKLG